MSFTSEPALLLLQAIRVRGHASTDTLVGATGLDPDQLAELLEAFDRDGWVRFRPGASGGWTLTGDGRTEGERRAAAELDASGTRSVVEAAYQSLLGQNPALLQLCTDWQLRGEPGESTPNDHLDEAYDAEVIARLVDIDAAIQPVCAGLAGALERFEGYGDRLTHAVEKVRMGEKDWFTKPVIDSYHTVWFELHENLLATLGIERGKETS